MCRICNSPPGNLGNHAGRLAVYKPFTGSPGVLLITTQGRPTHLTCGQTISRIIVPPPGVLAKRLSVPLSGQEYSLETAYTVCPGVLSVSLVWAGTYPHGWYSVFKLQGEHFSCSSYSPGKRPDRDMKSKKIKISFSGGRFVAEQQLLSIPFFGRSLYW